MMPTFMVMVPMVMVVMSVPAAAAAPTFVVRLSLGCEEPSLQLSRGPLHVDEVAERASRALVHVVLPALGVAEVRYGGVLCLDGAAVVDPAVHGHEGPLGAGLVDVLYVDVADHVGAEVVADHDVLDLAVLAQLGEDVLVELVKVLLDGRGVDPRHLLRGEPLVGVAVHVL